MLLTDAGGNTCGEHDGECRSRARGSRRSGRARLLLAESEDALDIFLDLLLDLDHVLDDLLLQADHVLDDLLLDGVDVLVGLGLGLLGVGVGAGAGARVGAGVVDGGLGLG